jgi:putative transposase
VVEKRIRAAYHSESAIAAEAALVALAGELDKTHPGAAASLREGMPETLTILRLGVPPTLARTLHSTDENVNGVAGNSRSLAGSSLPAVAA